MHNQGIVDIPFTSNQTKFLSIQLYLLLIPSPSLPPMQTKSLCQCGNNRCCFPCSLSKHGMKWGDDDFICLTILYCSA